MTVRSSLLLLLVAALCVPGCGPAEVSEAEPEADGSAETEAADRGGEGLMLGSAADLMVIDEDQDDQLASLFGGGSAAATDAARGGGTASGGGGSSSSSSASGGGGPSLPSLSDPGMGRVGGRTISADQIQQTITQNQGQVRACYERELKTNPSLRGKVTLSWTIGADGRVRSPRAVRNTTGNRELSSCLKRSVRGWAFPRAESPQDVEYPFKFKPKDF